MLAVPLIIVSAQAGGLTATLLSLLRLMALYAFTFIFMTIVTGAMAPYSYAIFGTRGAYLLHVITGALGFLLALTHGLIVVTQRYYRGYNAAWIIGPVALILLVFTVWVALDRKRLKKVWRGIHVINYAIFVGIFVKALLIGGDFKGANAAQTALMVLFIVYVAIAGLATLDRLRRYRGQMARRRHAAAAKAAAPTEAPAPAE